MSKLLHAGAYRLRKNKLLYVCLVIPVIVDIFLFVSQYLPIRGREVQGMLDGLFFYFLLLMGLLTAVFASMFVGTEYHDGTLRNKLIAGAKRRDVYLSNLFLCGIVGTASVLLTYAVGLAVGIPMFGKFAMPLTKIIPTCIAGVLLTLAYISIYNMVSMLSANKTNSAVTCILLAVVITIFAGILFGKLSQPEIIQQIVTGSETVMETVKNPSYIEGVRRSIYQNLLDLLPAGQAMQIFNQEVLHVGRMIVYSLLIIVGTNVIGMGIFERKDIK